MVNIFCNSSKEMKMCISEEEKARNISIEATTNEQYANRPNQCNI